jgi:transcriptional regulator with XRE-family HTH domain
LYIRFDKNNQVQEKSTQNISDIIRTIREEKKLTQLYMAKKLKVTQQAYSSMENNPENVTLKRLKDIAELLGVELITLLGIDTGLVQQNFGQKGGNAATKMVNNYTTQEQNELYERLIAQLKEEIAYLRTLSKKGE